MSAGRKNNADKKDWNTPPKYITPITEFFGGKIDLDPCSNENSMVNAEKEFIYPYQNGLTDKWEGKTIFVNPPYGRDKGNTLYDWLDKSIKCLPESEIIFLIPVATNTKHFKEIIFKQYNMICFLSDTRLKFYNGGNEDKKGAPMACCLCYKGNRLDEFKQIFEPYGKIFKI